MTMRRGSTATVRCHPLLACKCRRIVIEVEYEGLNHVAVRWNGQTALNKKLPNIADVPMVDKNMPRAEYSQFNNHSDVKAKKSALNEL